MQIACRILIDCLLHGSSSRIPSNRIHRPVCAIIKYPYTALAVDIPSILFFDNEDKVCTNSLYSVRLPVILDSEPQQLQFPPFNNVTIVMSDISNIQSTAVEENNLSLAFLAVIFL